MKQHGDTALDRVMHPVLLLEPLIMSCMQHGSLCTSLRPMHTAVPKPLWAPLFLWTLQRCALAWRAILWRASRKLCYLPPGAINFCY